MKYKLVYVIISNIFTEMMFDMDLRLCVSHVFSLKKIFNFMQIEWIIQER